MLYGCLRFLLDNFLSLDLFDGFLDRWLFYCLLCRFCIGFCHLFIFEIEYLIIVLQAKESHFILKCGSELT